MGYTTQPPDAPPGVDLSFVIPVYNGAATIGRVVETIHEIYSDLSIEVVLVNDGSPDDSEAACAGLARRFPDTVTFVNLARNFGEHSAVLAGLNHATGAHVAILDDDGQNPPDQVRRMYDAAVENDWDVAYGHYRVKHHSAGRNLGSRFNGWVANVMLHKPPGLYLSSFKVMNRFIVDEVTRYRGAFPYIDGLILRATANLGQVDVEHRARPDSESNYTLTKLFMLWLNMFLNFSILPLRLTASLGMLTSVVSLFLMVAIVVDKLYFTKDLVVGLPTVLVTIVFFAGVQLVILGAIGEYLGRLFLDHSGSPQFVVRYVKRRGAGDE